MRTHKSRHAFPSTIHSSKPRAVCKGRWLTVAIMSRRSTVHVSVIHRYMGSILQHARPVLCFPLMTQSVVWLRSAHKEGGDDRMRVMVYRPHLTHRTCLNDSLNSTCIKALTTYYIHHRNLHYLVCDGRKSPVLVIIPYSHRVSVTPSHHSGILYRNNVK